MAVVREGGLPRLVDAAQSMDSTLRLNGIWAAQNFAHKADLASKKALLEALPWDTFRSLLTDSDATVQVRKSMHGVCLPKAPKHHLSIQ